ncbi:MAG: anthranilate phosphoribosyltransferase [Candidatus Eremiobacteraeota bacterium]|nr:anthranilate phosphoribosyltransferase [Candidatus Eremiobacteraeota bacterium]
MNEKEEVWPSSDEGRLIERGDGSHWQAEPSIPEEIVISEESGEVRPPRKLPIYQPGHEDEYIRAVLLRIFDRGFLTMEEARKAGLCIMWGNTKNTLTAGFLTALRGRGVTVDEIIGMASAIRQKSLKFKTSGDVLVDTGGTGRDGGNTFNISIATAFVIGACGVPVAKQVYKGIPGNGGSADLLKELGIKLEISSELAMRCLEELGIVFLYTPLFHPSLKNLAQVRNELGFATVLDLLEPLCNPAEPNIQLLGVYDPALTENMAYALKELGCKAGLVVYSMDGLDELSTTGKNIVTELKDGKIKTYVLDPETLGFSTCSPGDLKGGDAEKNAEIVREILGGKNGPQRDVILLNSAAALYIAGASSDIKQGIEMAADTIDNGTALLLIDALAEFSHL